MSQPQVYNSQPQPQVYSSQPQPQVYSSQPQPYVMPASLDIPQAVPVEK